MLHKTHLIFNDKINQKYRFFVKSIIYLLLLVVIVYTCTYLCDFDIILVYTSTSDQQLESRSRFLGWGNSIWAKDLGCRKWIGS